MSLFKKSDTQRITQLETELKELREELKTLSNSCACASCGEGEGLALSTVDADIVNFKADYEYIDFNVDTTSAGIGLTWDSSKLENSLPTGHRLSDFRIVLDTTKQTVLNANQRSGQVLLPANATNPQLEVRVKVQSPEGIYRYDTVTTLDSVEQGEKSYKLEPTIPKVQRELNTAEMNTYLASELEKLKAQFKNM